MFPRPFFPLAALAIFLVSAQAAGPAATMPEPAAPPLSPVAREFLQAHNQARAAVGAEPLEWSEKLGKDTSLLWRKTKRLGCAQASCVKKQLSLTICFYDPLYM